MTHQILLLTAVIWLAFPSSSVASDTLICPSTINVRQDLASSVDGWTPIIDDSPHQLSGITFYDGPPAEKASLVYDDIRKSATKEVATWRFVADSKRLTSMVCGYSGTAVQLSRGLPDKTSTCQVTYSRTQQVSGQPMIESVSCK